MRAIEQKEKRREAEREAVKTEPCGDEGNQPEGVKEVWMIKDDGFHVRLWDTSLMAGSPAATWARAPLLPHHVSQ